MFLFLISFLVLIFGLGNHVHADFVLTVLKCVLSLLVTTFIVWLICSLKRLYFGSVPLPYGTLNSPHNMNGGSSGSSSSSVSEGLSASASNTSPGVSRLHVMMLGDGEAADDEEDDSETELYYFETNYRTCSPRHNHEPIVPDTELLEKSEFSLMTKTGFGMKPLKDSEYSTASPLLKMIAERERGMAGGNGFSSKDICNAMHHFLPCEMEKQDEYSCKAFCGTYSKDGEWFLSACQDRMLRLYNTKGSKFKLIRKIEARDVGWSILDTAFSPDGTCCVYSSWSENIFLVRLFGDSDCQDTLRLNPTNRRFCIFSLVFSQDGQEILCGANDGFLYVYDRFLNRRILKIDGHSSDVNTVAYADGTSHILYSGSDDGLCKVWDRRTLSETHPKPVGILAGHMNGITYIEPRGDGRHFLSNSKDQTIKLWDVRVFSNSSGQDETRKAVASQNWDYRWQRVPSKLINPKLKLKGDTSVMTYRGHNVLQTLIRCHFSPVLSTGQRYIYTGCAEGRVVVYDALTGSIVKSLQGHTACVRDVSWHPYKPELASTSWDSTVARWVHRCQDSDADDSSDDEHMNVRKYDKKPTRRSMRTPRRNAFMQACSNILGTSSGR